jgi:hypothetical protein
MGIESKAFGVTALHTVAENAYDEFKQRQNC